MIEPRIKLVLYFQYANAIEEFKAAVTDQDCSDDLDEYEEQDEARDEEDDPPPPPVQA